MTIKRQHKPQPQKLSIREVSEKCLPSCDSHFKIPASFCLVVEVSPCLFIEQRFARSRFIRTDVPSSQHRGSWLRDPEIRYGVSVQRNFLRISNREIVPLYFRELKTILAIRSDTRLSPPFLFSCDTQAC